MTLEILAKFTCLKGASSESSAHMRNDIKFSFFYQIKFLKSKEGSSMIQMGDQLSCDRAIKNLNNTYMFGNVMILRYRKTLNNYIYLESSIQYSSINLLNIE